MDAKQARNAKQIEETVKSLVSRLARNAGARTAALMILASLATGCGDQTFVVRENLNASQPSAAATPAANDGSDPRPTATPAPSATPTPAATASPSATPTPTPTPTPIPSPTATPVPTATPTPAATPQPTPEPTPVPTPTYAQCLDQMEQVWAVNTSNYLAWYAKNGKRIPQGDTLPKIYRGTNGKVIVMAHGFLASPAYMKDLAQTMTTEGYTVVVPILLGFGANEQAANASGPEMWQASIKYAIDVAKMCHSDVNVVAHSLGAGLTTDLIVNKGVTGISKLVLMAPYYQIASGSLQAALDVLSPFTDSVAVKELNRYLPWDFYDVFGLAHALPGEPEPFLPIAATQKVLDLHRVFEKTQYAGRIESPKVLLAITESDGVIKNSWAEYYPRMRFSDVTEFAFPLADNIPHSLQTRANNPRFDELATRISDHLKAP